MRSYLQELDDLAGSIACQPLYGGGPDSLGDVAEEGDDEIGGGKVRDEQVDSGSSTAHSVHTSQCRRVADQRYDKHDRQNDRLHDGQLSPGR